MSGLTHDQAACLEAIRRLTVGPVSPTINELQRDLRISSRGEVHRRLTALKDRGFIDWIPGRARSIIILADQVSDAVLAKLSTEALRDLVHRVYGVLADREMAA